jgi:uncharacterized RDD family membrane protein YckC
MSSADVRPDSAAEARGDGHPPQRSAHAAVAARAQAAAALRAHGPQRSSEPEPPYAGLVTRAIAFAIDAAIVDVAGATVGAVVGLALSVLKVPHGVDKVLAVVGGFVFVIWSIVYFVVFWSTTGETPGNRVMRIRVRRSESDEPLPVRWAIVRFAGLGLAAIPLLLGFLPILVTERRRGLQDLLGRSVVVRAADHGTAEQAAGSRSR